MDQRKAIADLYPSIEVAVAVHETRIQSLERGFGTMLKIAIGLLFGLLAGQFAIIAALLKH